MERPFADFFLEYLEYHIYFHKRLKQVAAHFGEAGAQVCLSYFSRVQIKKNSQDFCPIKGYYLYVSE